MQHKSIVWITGARGFIGRNLAPYLTNKGCSVLGLGHGSWASEDAHRYGVVYWINGEVNSPNLKQLLKQASVPEVIYHLAGGSYVSPSFQNPQEDFERTVYTTAQLLEWIRSDLPEVRLICASSAAVYGAGHSCPIRTNAALNPYSPYGFHKAMMEMLCRSYVENFGLNITIIRLFSVYGPGLEKQVIWDICCKLASDPATITMSGTGNEVRDWLHITDTVRLMTLVGELNRSPIVINGGTGEKTCVSDIVNMIANTWGSHTNIIFNGKRRLGDPDFLVADIEKTKALGFSPSVSLQQGISETVAWYKSRLIK
jgi:UDP-glucose 4-epimerase